MKTLKDYLNRTEKHLFETKNGNLFKIITFTKDDVDYFTTLYFNSDKVSIKVREVEKWERVSPLGKTYVDSHLKNYILFPDYDKSDVRTSVKHFKSIRTKVSKIKTLLEQYYVPIVAKYYWEKVEIHPELKKKVEKVLKTV